MPDNEPPLGQPIYDEPDSVAGRRDEDPPRAGEHVVITPQTAGSAGAAHPEEN